MTDSSKRRRSDRVALPRQAKQPLLLARETNDGLQCRHRRAAQALRRICHPAHGGAQRRRRRARTHRGQARLQGRHGAWAHRRSAFIDDKQLWPIFERAQALDVPIYVHPAFPHAAVIEAYYRDYASQYPEPLGPALGFTVETKTQAIRLVLSGVFKSYPRLKIILGHLGEGLPFLLWRIDQALSRPGNAGLAFKDTFREHFYVTTSGNFSDSALLCSVMEMGVDRILFSVDWPFVSNMDGMKWMETVSLCAEDKAKILGGNARRLLKLP